MSSRSNRLSLLAVGISCLALLLATIPPYVIETKIDDLVEIERVSKDPASIEVKGFKLSFGKEKKKEISKEVSRNIEELEQLLLLLRVLMFVTVAVTIFISLYAWSKEKNKTLSFSGIITACIAISWQYVAAGISTGVAVFILLVLISIFGC